MSKSEKLKELDLLVLDKIINLVQNDETEKLPELGNAIAYLRANQMVEEKKKTDTVREEIKAKTAEAKKRRGQQ